MEIKNNSAKKVLLLLLKEFTMAHTITSLAQELKFSRVGIWKILKKLENEKLISLKSVGKGKTNSLIVKINWENPLIEKMLSFYLTEEAVKQRRWQVNFSELEKVVEFVVLYGSILHSPREAGDIDVLDVAAKNNFVKIQAVINQVQITQSKKIHSIDFTGSEFKTELKKQNKAFIDAIKKGVILFGQENFVQFMKEMGK